MILIQSNFGLFFGRFHALVVHLPIGFLLLGSIFYLLSKREKWQFLQKALPITFLLSTLGAILSVIMGLFLAKEGGYNEQTLFWHRTLGIATAISSAVFYLHFSGRLKLQQPITDWGLLASVVLLSITGHFGGQLTHGKNYLLDHAPEILQQTLGGKTIANQELTFPMNPDSVYLYEHLIQPILEQKCLNCHNDDQARGGLNLASREGLLAGGDHGDVLKNKPEIGSPLLHRVTLESNDPKFMPPKGIPLNYAEIRLLDYWVNHDFSFEQTITDESIPKAIQQLIKRNYGLTNKRRSYVELAQVPAADPQQIQSLIAEGFTIKTLSQASNFLEVTFRDSIDCSQLEKLEPLKSQIA
ncbi:MAG: c-type cytochrome domain-containing protein, partial [Bacteroidota bacterium]